MYSPIGRLTQIYRLLEGAYDQRPEYEKDIWDLRKLGSTVNDAHSRYTLNFRVIHQPWLRQLAKMFLKYRLTSFSEGNCRHMLWAFSTFSDFLGKEHPHLGASEVNRALILEYFAFLTRKELTTGSRKRAILNLRIILEVSTREGWAPFPRESIIFEDDLPSEAQGVPRYIPDDVLNQLFEHLGELDEQMQAMVLILYEVGMRVSEMLTLPLDCLLQDAAGGWWIRYYQSKVRTEHTQPISRETAALVQGQQQRARGVLGSDARILFPGPNRKNIKYHAFARAINNLAVRKEIRDCTGHIWRFQPHQFRHTFGTRLINRGIPQHIVQRLMGHKSPTMTSQYAHVHDATLKREFEKTLHDRKLVDISGRVITANREADKAELQWLRKYVDARTLPNGLCAIPLALGPCPHPNACLTCPHFRTDQSFLLVHERQLRETEEAVAKAQANGWVVQEKNNGQIAENLRSIISALKDDDHGAQA
jgi:integrase